MATKALGAGDNWLHRKLLETVPDQYESIPTSYFFECLQQISAHTQKDGIYSSCMSRVWVGIALPISAGMSVIQSASVLLSHTVSEGFGQKEYVVVVNETGKKETKRISLTNDFFNLVFHVAAVAATIFLYVPGIIAPGLFECPAKNKLPKSLNEEELERLRVIESGQTELLAKAARLDAAEQEAARLRGSVALHPTDLGQASVTTFFHHLPPVNSKTLASLVEMSARSELAGITFQCSESTDKQATWGLEDGYITHETPFVDVPVAKKDTLLTPGGVIELKIDFTKLTEHLSKEILYRYLSKEGFQVHRLKFVGATLNELEALSNLFEHVHTLVLEQPEESPVYASAELMSLSTAFPKIACFDLEKCTFDAYDGLRELIQVPRRVYNSTSDRFRMVLFPKFERARVSFESDANDNITEVVASFQAYLHHITTKYNPNRPQEFWALFPDASEFGNNFLFHPAAPFMTKMSFLNGSDIRTDHFIPLVDRLPLMFPHLNILDLQRCRFLESKIFAHLPKLKVQYIQLQGSDVVYYRRNERARGSSPHLSITTDKERHYFTNMHAVVAGLVQLFNSGVKRVRLDGIGEGHQELDNITQAINDGVVPTLEVLNGPRYNAQAKIYFGSPLQRFPLH